MTSRPKLYLLVIRVVDGSLDVRRYPEPVTMARARAEVAAHAEQAAAEASAPSEGDALGYLMNVQLPGNEVIAALQSGGLTKHPECRGVIHRKSEGTGDPVADAPSANEAWEEVEEAELNEPDGLDPDPGTEEKKPCDE